MVTSGRRSKNRIHIVLCSNLDLLQPGRGVTMVVYVDIALVNTQRQQNDMIRL